jgi:two-component system, NtrC family, sensor kinase
MSEKEKNIFQYNMIKTIVLLLLSLSANQVISQQNKLNEAETKRLELLQQLSEASKNNLVQDQVKLLQQISDFYSAYKPDSSKYWYLQSVAIARQSNLKKEEFILLLGAINPQSKFYIQDSIQSFYERSIALATGLPYTSTIYLLQYYGDALEASGNYPVALQTYLKGLAISKQNNDSSLTARALSEVGNLYDNVNDLVPALSYYLQSLEFYQKLKDEKHLSSINNFIGSVYTKLNHYDSGRYYLNLSYSAARNYYKGNIPAQALDDIALSYIRLGDDSSALSLLRKCYFDLVGKGDYENYCETTMGLAQIFDKEYVPDSCIFYARKCLSTAIRVNILYYISGVADLLSKYANSRHQLDSAYYYLRISIKAKDTLNSQNKIRQFQMIGFTEQLHEQELQQKLKEVNTENRNNLEKYSLLTLLIIILLVALLLWRNNARKQKDKLTIEKSYVQLKSTQALLIQSEKMASLGELTAGIAHEIQNPLNFVNNFSEVNKELIAELNNEIDAGNFSQVKSIAKDIESNEEKINNHGKRADAIVKEMLQHSRSTTGQKEPTDINALAEEYLKLAYHGLRAKDNSFNATIQTLFDASIGKINIIPQDIGRVLLNLFNNAFYAVSEKRKLAEAGYEPTVSVATKKVDNKIAITVKDNGNGIPQKIVDKIFQPFFTTKPTGQGTGLGLSLSYDIVKAHDGEIKVNTREREFTEFVIQLPILT